MMAYTGEQFVYQTQNGAGCASLTQRWLGHCQQGVSNTVLGGDPNVFDVLVTVLIESHYVRLYCAAIGYTQKSDHLRDNAGPSLMAGLIGLLIVN